MNHIFKLKIVSYLHAWNFVKENVCKYGFVNYIFKLKIVSCFTCLEICQRECVCEYGFVNYTFKLKIVSCLHAWNFWHRISAIDPNSNAY